MSLTSVLVSCIDHSRRCFCHNRFVSVADPEFLHPSQAHGPVWQSSLTTDPMIVSLLSSGDSPLARFESDVFDAEVGDKQRLNVVLIFSSFNAQIWLHSMHPKMRPKFHDRYLSNGHCRSHLWWPKMNHHSHFGSVNLTSLLFQLEESIDKQTNEKKTIKIDGIHQI